MASNHSRIPRMYLRLLLPLILAVSAWSQDTLVIASGRGESLVGPILAEAAEAIGLRLDIRYGSTPALAAQIAAEGRQSPVDLFFAQEAGYLAALARVDLLAPLPEALLEQVATGYRDPGGRWVGISGRLRALTLAADIPLSERPRSLRDLVHPRWRGQVGWAPGNASLHAHVSVLRHVWGEDDTEAWLRAMRENQARVYPRNGPQVGAVDRGEIRIAWVNHYYLHQIRRTTEGTAVNHSFADAGKEGNLMLVTGMGIRSDSPRRAAAERLIAWLLTAEGQARFAAGYEYPLVTGAPAHEDLPSLADIPLTVVDASVLVDLAATVDLLRRVGLQ